MRRVRIVVISMTLLVGACAASAQATLVSLDAQVNNDAANGIDQAQDAGVSDVVGGALTAGALEIPWGTFEQKTGSAQNIFVRAFKAGAWVTEGFPASLNVDTTKVAEKPSIDFAGPGRTVPWVSWYEPNDNLPTTSPPHPTNIFASRFASNPAATGGGAWILEGQDRTASSKVPSLNINTNRTAENPSVAGGATVAGNDPVPWITWEENDGTATDNDLHRQIFVSKGVKLATTGAACPALTKPAGGNSVGIFCWQQVGADRLDPTSGASSPTGDPTLNIDPTRAGVEADIAFTGPGDTVPWVVWYEEGNSALSGFRTPGSLQVFAAKGVADATADGGFHWQAVGAGTAGQTNPLDTSGTHAFGPCAESQAADDACSLNKVATANAENPRVAAGSLTPGGTTVPWVVWQEDVGGGVEAIFVARLVSGTHFELFNGGAPVSNTLNNSTRPDITFSNNEPYVSWHETIAGIDRLFVGHFEGGAATPAFVLDTPTGITTSPVGNVPDLRAPISSTCTSTPFSSDGTSCRAGAAGTPFFLFTDGSSPQKLFGQAYAPTAASTGTASGVTTNSATVGGSVNPGGAVVNVHFDFGPSTAYGSTSPVQRIGPSTASQVVSAALTGLPANTTFHFRVVAQSDFTTVAGDDATFTTPPTPVPPVNDLPTSRIVGLPASIRARKLKRFHGTAHDADDGVKRVDVALVRLLGGAHAARKSCRALTSSGRLKRVALVRGLCRPSIYLRAKGTTKWSFTLKRRLPKGRYVLYSRATDKAGQRESGFKHGNRRAFRVR